MCHEPTTIPKTNLFEIYKENLKISQKNVKLKSRPKKSINWKLVHEVLNVTKSTQQLATIYTTYATKPILYS